MKLVVIYKTYQRKHLTVRKLQFKKRFNFQCLNMKTFILIAALSGLASCEPKVNLRDEVPIQDCGNYKLCKKETIT